MLVAVLLPIGIVTVALISDVASTGKLNVPFASVNAVEFAVFDDDKVTCPQ